MNDLVVVGGGPAGAACALWAHQLGMRVLLLEAGPVVGGLQLRSPYENRWLPGLQGRTGQEVAAQLHAHLGAAAVPLAVDFNVVSIRRDADEGLWEVASDTNAHLARHVVIATGSRPRRCGFRESTRIGIGPGLSMERLDVAGKRLAILGGGDNAFDMAVFALRRGAGHVDIYCRREPRAQPILQDAFPAHQVHVGAFLADPSNMTVNGASYDFFGVQFGFEACIPGGLQLPLHGGGVQVDRRGAVHGFPGLFAAGEVTNFWHPCVATSYAHGVQVATSIQAELAGRISPLRSVPDSRSATRAGCA
ncbi:NAD(P)/FAD-dependent oxidoreductase [soil metagenome]